MPTIDQITGKSGPNKLQSVKLIPLDKEQTVAVLDLETDFGLIRIAINRSLATDIADVCLQFIDRD